ncbi:MAG: cytochrome P450, partial [Gammaproteobacteria bacterium]
MPAWLHGLFPAPWRTFCRCWDYMFQFGECGRAWSSPGVSSNLHLNSCVSSSSAKGHIDQRLREEEEKLARGEEVEGRYLTYFLSRAGMPMKSVYSNVTELLLAGVDTVNIYLLTSLLSHTHTHTLTTLSSVSQISSTLSWSLYELSRHPEIQESLRSEVMMVLGDRRIPTAVDVGHMPLLKAVIKEITRYRQPPLTCGVVCSDWLRERSGDCL